jgi:heme-degrading monooxygenase HmoA
MYARVFRIQVDTRRIDEGIEIYEDGYVPEAEQQKGFKGAMLLGDRETGKGMAISMWESEADARATEQSGFVQQVLGRFTEIFAEPPTMEGYEIMVKADVMARTA